MTASRDRRLDDLMSRTAQTVSAAVTAIECANKKLVKLLEVRSDRPWSADEFSEYLDLCQRERVAHRQYLAARRLFDTARRRQSHMPAHVSEESAGLDATQKAGVPDHGKHS
jgi:hypothetical protein